MKKVAKLMLSIIVVVIVVGGLYFAFSGNEAPVTGATTAAPTTSISGTECVGEDAKTFFNACSDWKENDYSEKPQALKVLDGVSARQLCDRLLSKYKAC